MIQSVQFQVTPEQAKNQIFLKSRIEEELGSRGKYAGDKFKYPY